MIRINLLKEKVDHSAAYVCHALAFFGAVSVALLSCFFLHSAKTQELEDLGERERMLGNQFAQLKEKTKDVDNLEADKKLLGEKLTTIAKLKAKKSGPVRLLAQIADSMPERAWLTEIKDKPDGLEFKGVALDPQTVTNFVSSLKTSPWIASVEPTSLKQEMQDDVPVQHFALRVEAGTPLEKKLKLEQKTEVDPAEKKASLKAAKGALQRSGKSEQEQ